MATKSTSRIINVMCCGNVDDGKSSFLGRLLYETGNVYEDSVQDMEEASLKYSMRKEYSMLLDGLLEERRQQITIDVAHRYMDYGGNRINILDCPGHNAFLPSVFSAATRADCALLVIDIGKPISEQTVRHLEILNLFQVQDVFVIFNKFDLINYDTKIAEAALKNFEEAVRHCVMRKKVYFLSALNSPAGEITRILDDLSLVGSEQRQGFVLHVQNCVLNEQRFYSGKLLGTYDGSTVLRLYPGDAEVSLAAPIGNTGSFSVKENLDISRGYCLSGIPLCKSNALRGRLIRFGQMEGKRLLCRHGVRTVDVLAFSDHLLKTAEDIYFNNINEIRENGYCLLIDAETFKTLGLFVFIANEREIKSSAEGSVVWITGLSGTGKTTLAKALQSRFTNSILLDADDVRVHINHDLGYTPEDRQKNVNRIAGLAQILSNQGFMVIVACISQYRQQRMEIREKFARFYEIHLKTPPQDTKGIYSSLTNQAISGYEEGYPEAVFNDFSDIVPDRIAAEIRKVFSSDYSKLLA